MKNRAFYRPANAWMGDFIPYCENNVFYLYYLHDPRRLPGQYAEETTWHLVTTEDFRTLHYQGEAIARGGDDAPNRDIYTGSVLRSQDGECLAFYTAYNPDFQEEGRSVQSVMVAKGKNPLNLHTDSTFRITADGVRYEPFDWRDPYVFYNEEEGLYWMLLAARLRGAGSHRGGCIALCKSDDLLHWRCEEPFYAPNQYITMECPEVFQMGDWWYLVFSTFSDRFTTHYRKAKTLNGPWLAPANDGFDGRANYAIKTASNGCKRYAFGWIATRVGSTDDGPWEWGGDMQVLELAQYPNGDLYTRPNQAQLELFGDGHDTKLRTIFGTETVDESGLLLCAQGFGAAICPMPKGSYRFDVELTPHQETAEIGLAFNSDAGLEEGYFLRLAHGHLALDRWPRTAQTGTYQWQIRGDIPFAVETLRPLPSASTYHITLVREDSIVAVYVNNEIALSTRAYRQDGDCLGVYVNSGAVKIQSPQLACRA